MEKYVVFKPRPSLHCSTPCQQQVLAPIMAVSLGKDQLWALICPRCHSSVNVSYHMTLASGVDGVAVRPHFFP